MKKEDIDTCTEECTVQALLSVTTYASAPVRQCVGILRDHYIDDTLDGHVGKLSICFVRCYHTLDPNLLQLLEDKEEEWTFDDILLYQKSNVMKR